MSSLHEERARRGELVLRIREQDLVIETMNEAHKLLLAEKDAEIQRLWEELNKRQKQGVEQRKLITELADWVRDHSYEGYPPSQDLLHRAREATR
jgi:hypothetical protein